MFRKVFLPLFAAAGVFFAVWTVIQGAKPVPPSIPVAEPPRPPFENKISGAGIVEAGTKNIAVGTPVSGLVDTVYVTVGQHVASGTPLFVLDSRKASAALSSRETALSFAEARLSRLLQAPRREDLPPVVAKVKEAEADLEDLQSQLKTAERVSEQRALSREDLNRRRFAAQAANARLDQARANLNLLRAGAWKPDIDVAKAEVAMAEADVHAARVEIDLLTIHAPVDGDILQVNIRPGEFAQSAILSEPIILLGNLDRLHVRVDIDENDAWRFKPHSPAFGYVRGNPELKTSLAFEYLEPYVVPKRSLTGDSAERVDTRVMQVIYSFKREALNVHPGQLMDVYIEDTTARPVKKRIPAKSGKRP